MLLTKSRESTKSIVDQMKAGKKILLSVTIPIEPYHPIDFYNQNLETSIEKRFFWKAANENFYLVGLDAVFTLSSKNEEDRFNEIHSLWQEMIQTAKMIETNPIGTGPILLGGFSFDPKTKKEEEWAGFGDALFFLPKYMLSVINDEYFLTYNEVCEPTFADEKQMERTIYEFYQNLLSTTDSQPTRCKATVSSSNEIGQVEWLKAVERVVHHLKTAKKIKKVVLARKMELVFDHEMNPSSILQSLHEQQRESYTFAIENNHRCFLGATPERLIKITNNEVLSTCLAGSAPRGENNEHDEKLGAELLNDEKNRFEHQLVVKMIQEALAPHCDGLHVPKEPVLMKTPAIQHLYTPVIGKAKETHSIFKMVEQLHPTPALGGVPTMEALSIIRENERMDRGFYGAPIGWTDYRGNGEFIVGIRSGLIKEQKATLYAGCGLVSESKPEDELIETRIKFRPMLQALGGENK
ncbi:isochorismate synthase [Bacillus andreraoultii]|uniref:isochorismate synthase n=1 Tax=Bacillus andreraoultii TaxID=1499685 RepID=UPI00067F4291|nr:isochorismate synthase [Bacillus andreraoultii]